MKKSYESGRESTGLTGEALDLSDDHATPKSAIYALGHLDVQALRHIGT